MRGSGCVLAEVMGPWPSARCRHASTIASSNLPSGYSRRLGRGRVCSPALTTAGVSRLEMEKLDQEDGERLPRCLLLQVSNHPNHLLTNVLLLLLLLFRQSLTDLKLGAPAALLTTARGFCTSPEVAPTLLTTPLPTAMETTRTWLYGLGMFGGLTDSDRGSRNRQPPRAAAVVR
jgi:hypothetical protein